MCFSVQMRIDNAQELLTCLIVDEQECKSQDPLKKKRKGKKKKKRNGFAVRKGCSKGLDLCAGDVAGL